VADVTPTTHAGQPVAPALPSAPSWAGGQVRHSATWAAVASAVLIGLIADQSLRTGRFGVAASLTLVAGAGAAIWVGGSRRFESRLLAVIATLFAAFLMLRASPWLLWPDLFAAVGLLGLGASLALRGSVLDLGAAELAARAMQGVVQLVAGGAYVAAPVIKTRGRVASIVPVARGLLIALPLAALLAGLLASADPVFASFFNLNLDVGQLLRDVLFVSVGSLCAAGLLRLIASQPVGRVDGPDWRLGSAEALVVLAVLDAVFAAFAIAQVLAATGVAADTLRSSGVTYADYARTGFFQLLWVSGITLVVLVLAIRITKLTARKGRLAFMLLAECAIALTLMIDVVAFRRLSLYEEAYGFTMLRLYSHVFAVWLGLVFILLAVDFMGVWARRRWFIGATLTLAVVVLLGLNVLNPEATVVAFNTSHAQTAHKIDGAYLSELSSDATPALLASRTGIDPALRQQVTDAACAGPRSYTVPWAALNLSDGQAAAARRAAC
jgi:uncharacterized protein DUF4153